MATNTYTPTNNTVATYGENSSAVGDLQKQLNTQNAGKAGWVPLVVDNKYGDKTLAATKFGVPTSTSNVNNTNDASSYINGNQATDFNTKNNASSDTPPTKSSTQSYTDMFNELKKSVTPSTTIDTPNFTEQYKTLLNTNGVTGLETTLNDLKSQQKTLIDANNAQMVDEAGKPVAMNVISGRQSEEQKQNQVKLDTINRQIEDTSNQLTTKYNVVNNLMAYSKLDYQNAVDKYDTEFTKNLNLFNTVKGISDTQKSDAEKASDNARANLQIIYNNISSNAADPNSLTADEKANITKLETQAGLPVGFYSSLQSKNPKANILSTTTREADGVKYADLILQDTDGKPYIKSIPIGASDNKTSKTDTMNTDITNAVNQFIAIKKKNNWSGVNPDDYNSIKEYIFNTYGANGLSSLTKAMELQDLYVDN